MTALEPRSGGLYVDATFGAGGYARALLDRGATVIAIDRDPSAIRAGAALAASSGGRLRLAEARFGELDAVARGLGVEAADGVVLDVGVSSMQLDEAARGFSLRFDAPLDMRMEARGRSAADILREDDVETIADILFYFGEERAARRIARAIVADRTAKPFTSTLDLAGLIARVAPARRGEMTHPATRAFQALRIAVNDELGELVRGLAAAERLLKPGGRLAVVTFHSLEDRIVKQFFVSRSGQRARGLAPPAGRAGRSPADIRGAAPPAGRAERSRSARQSALALGEAAFRRAHRRAAASNRRNYRGAGPTAGATGEKNLMWRFMHAAAIAALIGSAAYVYGVKYQTIYASEQLVKTRHLIDKEKNAINLLRAEFAHLARPDRIQALADSKLGLEPLALSQIARIEELPDAQPKVELDWPHPRVARIHGRQLHPGGYGGRLDASGEVRNGRDPNRSRREAQGQPMGAPQSRERAG